MFLSRNLKLLHILYIIYIFLNRDFLRLFKAHHGSRGPECRCAPDQRASVPRRPGGALLGGGRAPCWSWRKSEKAIWGPVLGFAFSESQYSGTLPFREANAQDAFGADTGLQPGGASKSIPKDASF